MSAARLVLATHNPGKLTELRAILAGVLAADEITSAAELGTPDVKETGVTFAENALIKARALARATGLVAVADDSGLAVDVLGGAPGIFSARWAGRHGDDRANLELLLAQLADIAPGHRQAAFVCAAALVTPDGHEHVEHGYLAGTLTTEPRGDGGFGYDPILMPTGRDVTTAEIPAEEKNAISHRGQAFRALTPHIGRALGHDHRPSGSAGGPARV
ncbi:RdgB/HAM1 family non-canonical purine NTP pyrophosphatase [Pseudactinotalea sp. HY158]|uniref:RdgB/HAM1 family non-canonical purine NTP pyrophosphatase n=1 Tax=Pseudactinotalea sp. HY158 TaxID=2654547 RepID=UPI00129C33D7|nr:RdgB/HAM1 family non-canonical purine NTP pyrophosphatase [Pseudactinotalea sp. HY158]QGH70186.1 RdgB/HAM1 family non-canonical purine NTP pyrophosphatase [Pseudactinotalea sp. HY158]